MTLLTLESLKKKKVNLFSMKMCEQRRRLRNTVILEMKRTEMEENDSSSLELKEYKTKQLMEFRLP